MMSRYARHIKVLMLALVSMCAFMESAQADCRHPQTCEELRDCLGMPAHYCECHNATLFYYGMDTVITGDAWFRSSINDLKKGLMAYWQSEDSVLLEVLAFCSGDSSIYSRYINAHSSVYVSPKEINTLLAQVPTDLGKEMYAYLHFQPLYGGGGRAICFTGTDGAVSTCADPLELNPYCNYVFKGTQMFELKQRKKATYGLFRYRNEFDMSGQVEMKIHYGACDGPVVAEHVFVDSMKPYFVPNDIMTKAYKDSTSLFVEFKNTNEDFAAHVYYRTWTRFVKDTIDTVICSGKNLELMDTILYESTTYLDTICHERFKADTIYVHTYNLEFSDATVKKVTLQLRGTQFPYNYQGQVLRNYGEYEIVRSVEGECTEILKVTVKPRYTVTRVTVDSTLCQGMVFEINGKRRSTNGTVRDTVYSGQYLDQQQITTYRLTFTAPQLEYDTIKIHSSLLPYKYYGTTIRKFGETTVTIRQKDECTRKVQLMVLENDGTLTYMTQKKDTVGCSTDGIQFQDSLVMESMTYIDSLYSNDSTMMVTTWTVIMEEPGQVEYDTIALEPQQMPYDWHGFRVTHYGENEFTEMNGACESTILLEVLQRYIYAEIDTTLCAGLGMDIGDTVFYKTTRYVQTKAVNAYTDEQITWKIRFTEPEVEKDTLYIKYAELPYTYYGQVLRKAGTTKVRVTEEGQCDRLVEVTVVVTDTKVEALNDAQWTVKPTIAAKGQPVHITAEVGARLEVMDALGHKLEERTMNSREATVELPTEGLYIIVLRSSDQKVTRKVVVR